MLYVCCEIIRHQNFYRDCTVFPKIYVQSITKVTNQKELSILTRNCLIK